MGEQYWAQLGLSMLLGFWHYFGKVLPSWEMWLYTGTLVLLVFRLGAWALPDKGVQGGN